MPQKFAAKLLRWYDGARRDLPWRHVPTGQDAPDPYHVLVSEAMLQQTQVATVIPYFNRFIAQFDSLSALATADEQAILRAWQGLGYYSRARNLQKAARQVMNEMGGQLPREAEELLKLPGIGRYTAGAIASIAFGRRAPIVDGNVARVLCRIDKIIVPDLREKTVQLHLWRRAEEILPQRRVGDFNSALMELGATVCMPRSPQCLICPVQTHCEARAAGVQDSIPAPRKAKLNPLERRWTFCIHRDDRWLIEKRPASGRWAGLWQFITVPVDPDITPIAAVRAATSLNVKKLQSVGQVTHGLTHRRYEFEAMIASSAKGEATSTPTRPRLWATLDELDCYPLSRPQLKIAAMLRLPAFATLANP